jgi:hypothetical protein
MSGTAATSLHTPTTAVSGTFVRDIVIAAAIIIGAALAYLAYAWHRRPAP